LDGNVGIAAAGAVAVEAGVCVEGAVDVRGACAENAVYPDADDAVRLALVAVPSSGFAIVASGPGRELARADAVVDGGTLLVAAEDQRRLREGRRGEGCRSC